MKFIATLLLVLSLTACVSTHSKPVHFNVHHNCFDAIMKSYEVDTQRMYDGLNITGAKALKTHHLPISEGILEEMGAICIENPYASFDEAAIILGQQKFSSP